VDKGGDKLPEVAEQRQLATGFRSLRLSTKARELATRRRRLDQSDPGLPLDRAMSFRGMHACVRACMRAWSGRQALRECRLASNLSKGYKYASRGKPRRGNHIRARIKRPPRLAGQYLGMLGKLSYLWTVRRVQIVRARLFGDGHLFFKRSNERAARQSPT